MGQQNLEHIAILIVYFVQKAKGTADARKHASDTMKDFFRDPENRRKRSISMKGMFACVGTVLILLWCSHITWTDFDCIVRNPLTTNVSKIKRKKMFYQMLSGLRTRSKCLRKTIP